MSSTPDSASVLLVENNGMYAAHLVRLLAWHHYTVALVPTGQAALERLRHTPDYPQLILLSLESSRLDGVDFRREQIRDPRLRHIPVVIYTPEPLAPLVAAELEISFYLRKPIHPESLLLMVESHCRSPATARRR